MTRTRRDVLAALAGSAGALAAGAALPPAAGARPAARRALHLLDTHVAGTAYYDARRVRGRLAPGAPLVLRREPANPYDALATEVLTRDGAKLGYVPRFANPPIARLMDAGLRVEAEVRDVGPGKYDDVWMRLRVKIGIMCPR